MPLPPIIAAQLQIALASFAAAHGGASVPSAPGKAMEAWILMRLANAARAMPGWTVTLRAGDESLLSAGGAFVLPSQPSGIPPWNPLGHCYVLIEYGSDPFFRFELRGSLQWKGRSDARHECDVSLVPAIIAHRLRVHGGGSPRGLPIVAIECKHKDSRGALDETRETLARMYDLALVTRPPMGWGCRIYEDYTYRSWGRSSTRYLSFFRKGLFGIARSTGFQPGATTLAEHYSIARFPDIFDPAAASIARLERSFQQTLERVATF